MVHRGHFCGSIFCPGVLHGLLFGSRVPELTIRLGVLRLLALLLELMVMKVMGNHAYSFNGTNKLQLEGGPIGLKLSGATEELEPGSRFIKEEGKLRVVEEEVEGDKLVAGDLRTAKVLTKIGNIF